MKKFIFVLLALLPVFSTLAQETCEVMLDACAELQADHACIAGMQIPLTNVQNIDQLESDTYQVAVVNASIGLPRSTGGVSMLLMGSAYLENTVTEGFLPVDPIRVTALAAINVRSRPSTNDTVLTSINPNTELEADALSADEEWLRVVINGTPGWIFRTLVTGENIDSLPVIAGDALMQAFNLSTGDSGCGTDALIVQGLETQAVRLTVNGVDINLRGTIALESEERPYIDFANDPTWFAEYPTLVNNETADDTPCRFTTLSAIDGEAFLNNYRFSVPRGFRAIAFDCGENSNTPWQRSLPISGRALVDLTVLEDLPEDLLRAQIDVPTPGEVAQISSQLALAANTRVVRETVVTATEPEAETEASADNPVDPATAETTAAGVIVLGGNPADCEGFRPTHPLTGIAFGFVRFYWDPAPGATSYQVNLYNFFEEFVASFFSEGSDTSARVSTMSPEFNVNGTRQPFLSYEVIAYQDGAPICQTPRQVIQRDFDPDPDCPPSEWFSGTCEDFIADEQ